MSFVKKDFSHHVQETFHHLVEEIEENYTDDLDLDIQEGFLQITSSQGDVWLLNRHSPTQEIWLSSPHNGGHHFSYEKNQEKWLSHRAQSVDLHKFLKEEFSPFLKKGLVKEGDTQYKRPN